MKHPATLAAMLGLEHHDDAPRVVQIIDLTDPAVRSAFAAMRAALRSENDRDQRAALDALDAVATPTLLSDLPSEIKDRLK